MSRLLALLASPILLTFALAGCASSGSSTVPGVELEDAAPPDVALAEAAADTNTTTPGVRRLPCLDRTQLATDLLPGDTMGALEGELVSVVMPGTPKCPADANHLHLQIAVGDKRYDVAVTVDSDIGAPVAVYVHELAMSTSPSGWAIASLDYEQDLGVPSTSYQPLARDALLTRLGTLLKDASKVRIFGKSYLDGTGVHNVHRNGRGRDGAIVVHTADKDRVIALRFAQDVF